MGDTAHAMHAWLCLACSLLTQRARACQRSGVCTMSRTHPFLVVVMLVSLPVLLWVLCLQVWDDELEQLQYDWATAQAGADVDSEDSNAEDHYANDYPDEDDCSYHDSLDSSDAEDEPAAGRYDVTERIGFYQPGSSSKGPRSRAHDGRDESRAGADESSEFDVDEYESSGDGEEEGREEQGPSWLRKHCTAYAGGDGGQAWRAVLAQQFAPGPSH